MTASFSLFRKYERIAQLPMVYVWNAQVAADTRAYAVSGVIRCPPLGSFGRALCARG